MGYTLLDDAPQSSGYSVLPDQPAPPTKPSNTSIIARAVLGPMLDVGMGVKQAWDSGAQLLEHGVEGAIPAGTAVGDWLRNRSSAETENQKTLDFYNQIARPQDQPTTAAIGRGAGQALVTSPITPAGGPGLFRAAGVGAGMGGLVGLLTPDYNTRPDDPNFLANKAATVSKDALIGAGFGPAVTIAGNAISPVVGAGVKMLRDAGVRMTPGQAAGGMWNAAEDKLMGLPFIGDLIRGRRYDSIVDFNKAIYDKALAPFGIEYQGPVGHEGIKQVGDFLSSQYELALSKSVPSVVDNEFRSGMGRLVTLVPSALRDDFIGVIKRTVGDNITPAGTLTPSVARAADSELGRLYAQYKGSSVGSEREYASALFEAQQQLRDLVGKYNPEAAPITSAANAGWRTLVQMENAGALKGAADGVFTPSQFLGAVKKSDTTVRDRAMSRGEAFNQEFADTANRLLPNKVPDSGTVARGLFNALAASAATGSGALAHVTPAGWLGGGAAALAYAPKVNPFITSMMTAERPEAMVTLGDLLRRGAPYAALTAGEVNGP